MEEINDRVQFIVTEYYDGNVSKYCRDIDVKQSTMNDILGSKKMKPSASTLAKMLSGSKAKINLEWLLTGEGSVVKPDIVIPLVSQKESEEQRIRMKMLEERIFEMQEANRQLIEQTAVLKYKLEQKKLG